MHILIIDDNKELVFGLKKLLKEAGFDLYVAYSIQEAYEKIDALVYDLIILDWMFPDGNGIDFLQKQRALHLQTPILFLSSKNEAHQKAQALNSGADDYLEKPFSHVELIARIRALLRRESTQKQIEISIQNLRLNFLKREVFVDDEAVFLSKKEFELLEFLVTNANVVLTRYQISEYLNRDFDALKSSNIVDAHIKNLRKKLGNAATLIETVRGVGFTIKMT